MPAMSTRECSLPSCQKSVANPKHLACSEIHHFLLMAHRFSSLFPHTPAPPPLSPDVCAFSPCSQIPLPGHDCCSRTHHLQWLQHLHRSLSRNQICKLNGCFRHVFVESTDNCTSRAHEFCGWSHCQEFLIRNAQGSISESNSQLEPRVESLIETLKNYARNKHSPPMNVQVCEDFFERHPWEILNQPGIRSCTLIARCKFKGKDKSKRELTTKEGFHWKQSSQKSSYNGEVSRKYLSYTRLRSRKRGRDEIHEPAYTMTEYMVLKPANDDEKNYCVVKLCQENSLSLCKQSAKKARKNFEGDSDLTVGSRESATQEARVHRVADHIDILTELSVANGHTDPSTDRNDGLMSPFLDCDFDSILPGLPEILECWDIGNTSPW